MSLLQANNELPLNTDGTASLYASYLKKFSLFVRNVAQAILSYDRGCDTCL